MVDKTVCVMAAEMAGMTAEIQVGMTVNKTAAKTVGMMDGMTAV